MSDFSLLKMIAPNISENIYASVVPITWDDINKMKIGILVTALMACLWIFKEAWEFVKRKWQKTEEKEEREKENQLKEKKEKELEEAEYRQGVSNQNKEMLYILHRLEIKLSKLEQDMLPKDQIQSLVRQEIEYFSRIKGR